MRTKAFGFTFSGNAGGDVLDSVPEQPSAAEAKPSSAPGSSARAPPASPAPGPATTRAPPAPFLVDHRRHAGKRRRRPAADCPPRQRRQISPGGNSSAVPWTAITCRPSPYAHRARYLVGLRRNDQTRIRLLPRRLKYRLRLIGILAEHLLLKPFSGGGGSSPAATPTAAQQRRILLRALNRPVAAQRALRPQARSRLMSRLISRPATPMSNPLPCWVIGKKKLILRRTDIPVRRCETDRNVRPTQLPYRSQTWYLPRYCSAGYLTAFFTIFARSGFIRSMPSTLLKICK